ncbi:MAG: valine--tRNA ligase [Akkermansia sp.]
MSDLPKAYEPGNVEEKWQARWIADGCFKANSQSDKPAYSIVIPPPNVTGVLHLGHVLNNTIQDILARRARQKGFETLWLPGTDHAGIATQVRVEKHIRTTTGKTRHDIGREAFLNHVWEWKEKHGGIIFNQLKKLGCSCDWDRERFTMDEGYTKEVCRVFIELFKEGLIYRGRRMVNWCPVSLTALSDEEVIMKDQHSKLYTITYQLEDGSGALQVATTRPETIMADVAVAVNPKDPRFGHLVGKKVIRPLNPAPIPIVADEHVEIDFGTGALKITPAHDKTDFEVGQRFGLEIIDILTPDGHINCPDMPELHGMERFAARDKSEELLNAAGLLVKVEPYDNKVGFSERADVPVEPRLSMQWFLKYPCVKEAADAVAQGDITFRPARWAKTYAHWLENIQDWCISRQLWWGHRIPVWYRKDKADVLKEAASLDASALDDGSLYVGTTPPSDPENWVQDGDVMDTWFSSWLWPFSTMDDDARAKFYPTTDLVTGPDIIFFWVARMIMAGYRFEGKKPFSNVFFTSIIRDSLGRKMSKSLGNSPDPLDLMAKYGADGLRFGLMRIAPTGTDVRFDEVQIGEGRNFANKLYNAIRFRLMQGESTTAIEPQFKEVHIDILAKLKQLHLDVAKALEDYEFNALTQSLYQFFWSEYCSLFLEAVKLDLREGAAPAVNKATLITMDTVLKHYLALLHPVMPHITEELWQSLGFATDYGNIPLMATPLPSSDSLLEAWTPEEIAQATALTAALYESANRARNLKTEYNLSSNKNVSFILNPAQPNMVHDDCLTRLALLSGAKAVSIDSSFCAPKGTPVSLTPLGELFLPLDGLIDIDAERERITKEMAKTEKEIVKSKGKLSSPNFVDKAPANVVEQERERLQDWTKKIEQLKSMLGSLS